MHDDLELFGVSGRPASLLLVTRVFTRFCAVAGFAPSAVARLVSTVVRRLKRVRNLSKGRTGSDLRLAYQSRLTRPATHTGSPSRGWISPSSRA